MRYLIINCSPVRNGATACLCDMLTRYVRENGQDVQSVCIEDYEMALCRGCRACHTTGECVTRDGAQQLLADFEKADRIVCVSPSYWADVPAQFKVFIDRCTPFSNTHEPRGRLSAGKKGYAAVLRTGPGSAECEKIIACIAHFLGHLDIETAGSLALCSIAGKQDLEQKKEQISAFCTELVKA